MAINPKKCNHIYQFASTTQSAGMYHPKTYIILFCVKCANLKTLEIKLK